MITSNNVKRKRKASDSTVPAATLREVAPVLLLNDSFSLSRGEDVYALVSLVSLGQLSKDMIRSHYESGNPGADLKWLGTSTELSKLTIPKLRGFIDAMGYGSSKDKKSQLVSFLSRFEGVLRYLPAQAIGYANEFAKLLSNSKLLEGVVGTEAMEGVLAMVSGANRFRDRIQYVDSENLLTALVQDTGRHCTKKTCKTVLLLTDKDIAGMPCKEAKNPFYSSRGRMHLYELLKALEMSMQKHGGWNGLLVARDSANLKKIERKRKRQELQQSQREAHAIKMRAENMFFEEHTSFAVYYDEEEEWQMEEANNYRGRYIDYAEAAYDEARVRALKEWVEFHYDTLEHDIQQDYFPPSLRKKALDYYEKFKPSNISRGKVMRRDMRQARLAELQEEFDKRQLPIRDDSRLIKGYLARENPCPNQLKFVADTMEEMRFYHEHTDYRNIYSDIWEEWEDERDFARSLGDREFQWIDKDQVSEEAKKRALEEWVLMHSKTLEHDIMQDGFPPSLRNKARSTYRPR